MNELTHVAVTVASIDDFDGSSDEKLKTTLVAQAQKHHLRYLLAYHDDGVVWGRFEDEQWTLSAKKFKAGLASGQQVEVSPPFRALTLQECRAFGPTAELLIWRHNGVLKASILMEIEGDECERFPQTQLLWGDTIEDKKDGFTLLREGAQGLRHAVPLDLSARPDGTLKERVRLTVYHYIGYKNNQAYVKWSRLVSLNGD
jgi:CRISPR-associated protein (TIGR03984 family)